MPDHLAAYRATVIDAHPEWEHRLWTDEDFGWLQNQALFDAASEISAGHEGQLRSDIARYEILHRYGGVYVDCDMEALRPLDPLLEHRAFAAWELDGVWVNNAVLGAEPGHPMLAQLIRRIPAQCRRHKGKRPNRITGPHLVTPVARAHRHTVELLPSLAFYPYGWDELDRADEDYPNSLMIHHWWNQRKLRQVGPPAFRQRS